MQKFLPYLLIMIFFAACKKNGSGSGGTPIANNKAVAFIKTYGGSNNDFAYSVVQAADSSFVLAGASRSTDGDITGGRIGYDAWVAKVDKLGGKVWNRTFGENNDDYANSIINTPDGGFLIAGYSFTGNGNAAWAVKLDGNGNQQWRKDFTESADAKIQALLATPDGGYFVAGHSFINTTKYDGWVLRLDASGNKMWSKNYGGSQDDFLTAITKAGDAGYVLSGYTQSANGDLAKNSGSVDGWVIKIDDGGTRSWSKTFGGSRDDYARTIIRTADNGYMIAGNTNSNDGDISGNKGSNDDWVLKIDASGTKQWSKTFGGDNDDYANGLVATTDGSYIVGGYTNSTNGDVTRPAGDFGGWILKIDGNGNKTSVSSTYGYNFDDYSSTLINTLDGGYLFAGFTSLTNTNADGWLVKIGALQ
jgi:hypothetical protein